MPQHLLDSPGVVRPMWRLAIPVLGEQVLVMLVGFVDTGLTGRYLVGEAPLAAIGLMAYSLWLLPSMFAVVSIGATAVVARHTGAREPGQASQAMNQAILCGVVLAGFVMWVCAAGGDRYVTLMNLEGEAADLARRYIQFLVPAIPAIMIQTVGVACLRGAGDTVSGLVAMAIMNGVNVVVSISLVLGLGPVPHLGWDGLAIGTMVGQMVGALIVLMLLIVGRAGLRLRAGSLRPNWNLSRRILRVGVPGGMDILAILACHMGFLSIINGLGTTAAAAHSLAIRIESIAYLPGAAFQVAASTMAGQYLGAKDPKRAVQAVLASLAAGGGLMILAGLAFYFAGGPLTRLFTGSMTNQATELNIQLLKIAAYVTPSLAIQIIISGALRGAGDTRWPLVINLAGLLGIRIPMGIWLAVESFQLPLMDFTVSGMGWGAAGAWMAMLADVVVRSGLLSWRFAYGSWRKIEV